MAAYNEQQPAIRLDQVPKSYPGGMAHHATSFEISAGEAVAIVGPSGSGKTTLLHLMGGVIQPDSGDISLNGHRLSEMKPSRELSSLVGVIHQQYDLVPHLSVLHNVLAGRLGQWGILPVSDVPGVSQKPDVGRRGAGAGRHSRQSANGRRGCLEASSRGTPSQGFSCRTER